MFLSIYFVPEWLAIVAFGIGLIYGICLVVNAFDFRNPENLLYLDGTLTKFKTTRLNFIAVINDYEYEYFVEGAKYEGKESECFLFKQKRPSTMPTQVKLVCVKNKPYLSRLEFINHEHYILKGIAAILICAAFLCFFIIF